MSLWYGIENIEFLWHGTQADPEIEYKGFRWSTWMIEDALYDGFLETDTEESYEEYVRDNAVNYLDDCLYGLGYFNVDFIRRNAPSWFEHLRNELECREDGWYPMTDDDVLKHFAGIEFTIGYFINMGDD